MVGIRSCIRCRKREEKSKFFRIVPDNEKKAILDEKQNINTRGIYICKNKECLQTYIKVIKKGKINIKIDLDMESLVSLLESLIVGRGE